MPKKYSIGHKTPKNIDILHILSKQKSALNNTEDANIATIPGSIVITNKVTESTSDSKNTSDLKKKRKISSVKTYSPTARIIEKNIVFPNQIIKNFRYHY